jgi:hypothetical protein
MRNRVPEGPVFDLVSYGRRGPGLRDRLSLAQMQQIARTVACTPEVMVKVLPGGANSLAAVRQHLAYVGRQGDVELQTDDGQRLQDREAAADLIEDWDLDLAVCQSGLGIAGSAGTQTGPQTGVLDADWYASGQSSPCDARLLPGAICAQAPLCPCAAH